ncbi:hypothetical protein GCM10022243_18510 [Saccharothrix violaceirubra]|uniref:Diguanylate cyclase (GGDEF)-like protein n=1 Tax=Saccharothrix violaceirubra TaxID=413306 RepID=A0A7W7T275_9PSEU|nr:diguanylate cyclase [Saccharothrix violaceirubra]MBB4965242.1 diguanylate cyclase (GGDEF)-like protein [Saccharothrix violaceirubra]
MRAAGTGSVATRDRLWWYYLVVGLAAVGVYYALPIFVGTIPLRVLVYCAVSASAAVAVGWGLRRHRPEHRAPWIFLGLGQLVYAAADTTFYTAHYVLLHTEYPSVADVLYLAHYPLAVVALLLLIRRRRRDRDLPGLLDALSLTVAAGVLSWVFVIGPQTRLGTPLPVELASLGYPVMDLALLLAALRLLFGAGARGASFVLLTGWLAAILTADTVYVLQRLSQTYAAGNFLDAIWLTGNLALGAAALHPSMGVLARPAEPAPARLTWPRLVVLAAGAIVGPIVLIVQYFHGEQRDVPVLAAGCAVLFALIASRLAGLAVDQRRLAITDSLTGLYGRRHFEACLDAEVARSRRTGADLGVVILDVDRFKSINDRFGHPGGDRVLVEIAARLRAVAGSGAVLARHGGEEFALLAVGVAGPCLVELTERLRGAVSRTPIEVGGRHSVTVTVSAGTASFAPHHGSASALVTSADQALYRAKEEGRDRAVAGAAQSFATQPSATQPPDGEPDDYLDRLADAVDAARGTPGRSAEVAEWARTLAERLSLDPAQVRTARRAGRLLDVGLIAHPCLWAVLERAACGHTEHHAFDRLPVHGRSSGGVAGGGAVGPASSVRARGGGGAATRSPVPGSEGVVDAGPGGSGLDVVAASPKPPGSAAGTGPVGREGHVETGALLVAVAPDHDDVAEVVRRYRDPWDGARIEARIVAVCDTWAALLAAGTPADKAADELRAARATVLDPDVVDLFLALRASGHAVAVREATAHRAPGRASRSRARWERA